MFLCNTNQQHLSLKKSFFTSQFIFLLVMFPCLLFAQNPVEMADIFRRDGKIYVVVAIIAVILFGIFFYLYRTEKKVNDLSNKLKK